jgi:nucleoside-diphosphate-sugar epimerase
VLILLTGSNGFTGKHFEKLAKSYGHNVVCLRADLLDVAALQKEISDISPSAVVHLAGISFVAHANNTDFYNVNVVGTTNLLSSLTQLADTPHCVLIASSANVYGNAITNPIDETLIPSPVNHYATSKLAMEYMARTYSDRLPIVIARPFNYTGVGQDPNFVIPKLVNHFARHESAISLGNLHVEREYNDVRFVCESYLRLLDKGEPGQIYNICSDQPYTLHHVIEILSSLAGYRIDVNVNPAFIRANEIHRLCGSPIKLNRCIGESKRFQLVDTLKWMLQNAH